MFKLIVVLALVGSTLAQFKPPHGRSYERILRQRQEIDPIGSYNWQFETENGITANEEGRLRAIPAGEALRAEGQFRYVSPEGVPVHLTYVADEDGFQPQSNVLPTPPPTPDYIIRSLDWQKNHPEPADTGFRRF